MYIQDPSCYATIFVLQALHEPALKYKSVQQYVKMSSKALKQIEK